MLQQVPPKPDGQNCLFLYWQDETSPVCLIGHQTIRGKVSELDKPFLVIDTRTTTSNDGITECNVVMIIRRRILFKDRPKPILF